MYINQISYITAESLDVLQQKIEEEMIHRAELGHVFQSALPLVPKKAVVGSLFYIQPLVFGYQAEEAEVVDTSYFERLDENTILFDGKYYRIMPDVDAAQYM